MRNLRSIFFEETLVGGDLPLTATAWDTGDGSVICAFGPTPTNPTIELKRKTLLQNPENIDGQFTTTKFAPIISWDAPCPLPDLQCDEILLMQHFADSATVCLVLAGGDLVLVRLEPESGQETIEIVGSIDAGISAAAWAPDEELLALVTRDDNLVLMSRHLEPITETKMTSDDLQASRHVSVGWGKKETQFQGKRAKAMRDPTMPEHVDEGKLSPYEDGTVSVSWRGDGEYLALNSIVKDHRRVIRVYSREGVLDSVSEPVDGLESSLSWKPSGNLIASIKRTGDSKMEVVFFERNGLRHGEFPLRLKPPELHDKASKVSLTWNVDSSVLAVSLPDSVQFWTTGNYHYYLKQDLRLNTVVQSQPVNIKWHSEKPLRCCLSTSKKILELEFGSQVCRGSTVAPHDSGTVAVVDGTTLKLTPLRYAGVPPPMAFCEIDAGSNIIDCSISSAGTRVAVLTSSYIRLFNWQLRYSSNQSMEQVVGYSPDLVSFDIPLESLDAQLEHNCCSQICFNGDHELIVLSPAQNTSNAKCHRIMFERHTVQSWERDHVLKAIHPVPIPPTAQNLLQDVACQSTWVQDSVSTSLLPEDGGVPDHALAFTNGQTNTSVKMRQSLVQYGSSVDYQQIYLTQNGTLFAGSQLLARDCTSFVVTETHIVFTTSQHLLKFIHLDDQAQLEVPGDTPEDDERCRTVERGARIVTVTPSIYAVILQMPRGNLETIYPRVLVVSGIRKCLQSKEYRTAFLACQNHQVDMNILYDYSPQDFLKDVAKVIEQLKKPSRIDEFLSKLKEEDVTQTLYKDTLKASNDIVTTEMLTNGHSASPKLALVNSADKVNSICNAFISILDLHTNRYLQNIISAHVCKRPPDLTAALTLVSSLRQDSPDEADSAIAHLCFLTDANRLYDAALALYDLELTLLVAQNAQRDPREYMPFLQNLQSLPSLRRQYTIDNHLRSYARALTSLHALEAHDEVQAYTIKHLLYTTAMDLYKYDTQQLPKIAKLYAEHLESQSQYISAATLYESLGDFASAYPLYALAHQWRESLTCASLIPLDAEKLRNHATTLATTCADESRDYRAAATIYIDYLSDIPGAAQYLCKGSYFAEATRILSLHNLSSQIPSIIDPGLTEKFGEIIELVADCKSQLAAQIPRIHELRQKKAEDPLAFYGGDATAMAADGIDIPDNISLAATDTSTVGGQSLFTRYGSNASKFGGTVASNVSRKTSKTKRREERKRARGKKGSVYEEEYLVSSVARLIERVNGIQDEVKRLVSGLLRRGMREQGTRVDEVMSEIAELCEKARKDVWQVQGPSGSTDEAAATAAGGSYDVNGEGRPGGADGVFWDAQQEVNGVGKKQAPEVKLWIGNPLVSK